jgi:hypothetical protein
VAKDYDLETLFNSFNKINKSHAKAALKKTDKESEKSCILKNYSN